MAFISFIAIRPPVGATCIRCKFCHQVAPLALVPNLATRWCHLHKLPIWPPGGATCISFQIGHQVAPESYQLSLQKVLSVTDLRTHRSDPDPIKLHRRPNASTVIKISWKRFCEFAKHLCHPGSWRRCHPGSRRRCMLAAIN